MKEEDLVKLLRSRIAVDGERLARRQIINDNLESDRFSVSHHGRYVLGIFDRIVAKDSGKGADVSDQSPPSEHDQLGWLMGEVDRLRAELEQARGQSEQLAALKKLLDDCDRDRRKAEAELEQAREDYEYENSRREWAEDRAQRYRNALAEIRTCSDDERVLRIARDVLAGDQQEGWFGSPR